MYLPIIYSLKPFALIFIMHSRHSVILPFHIWLRTEYSCGKLCSQSNFYCLLYCVFTYTMQNLFGFLISDSGHYLFLPITYLVYRVWLLFYLYIYFYTNSPSLRLILLYSINLYLKIKAIETILNRTIYVNLTKKITIANK